MNTLIAMVKPAPGERSRLGLSVVLAAGAAGAGTALLATSGYLISRAAERPMIIALTVSIVAVRAFGIARAALRYAERVTSHDLALRQLARLRVSFYRHLAPLVPGQVGGRGSGELLARFVSDIDTLKDAQLRVLTPALVALAVVASGGIAAALLVGAADAALLAALLPAAMLSSWASAAVAAASARHQSAARARLTCQVVEAIDGSAELALAARSSQHVRRLADSDARLARLARRDALAEALAAGLDSLLTGAGLLAVLVVTIGSVRAGAVPGVLLAAIAFLFLGACETTEALPVAARRLHTCMTAASRLREVHELEPLATDPARPARPPADGALELEGVSTRYGPDEAPVLDGVDLRIAPGERVALLGPSGAGKTTIAELLVRFRDPQLGRVSLDGVDVRRLRQADLRQAVLLCGQDAHLFNTTIRENLLIGCRDAGEPELWDVLATVELKTFTAGLTDGLDTRVGQRGELLSGGQRQRFALARALLAPARFLILDEPLAHLDVPLARRVMRRVLEHAGGRGVLVITHDIDSLELFDRVVRLPERGGGR